MSLGDSISIWTALAEAQKAMEQPVMDSEGRAGKNGARVYKYASLASVRKSVFPPCNERGIFITQHFDGGNVLITEAHMGEQSVILDHRIVALSGNSQADGSAETYAKRYALCSVFGLAGIEDDDGASSGESKGLSVNAQCVKCSSFWSFQSHEQMQRAACPKCGGTEFAVS